MLNSIFEGTTIPLLEKIAIFGERRQQALAANVANIDTPNYKRRDLPTEAFQQALRDAIASGRSRSSDGLAAATDPRSGGPLAGTSPAAFPEQLFQAMEATSPSINFQDNNNRSIEHEMMEMTKNNGVQSYAIELMNAQLAMLQAAIREQV